MRLIDADELLKCKFHPLPYTHITPTDVDAEAYKRGWNDALDAVADDAPTIDPVRHGRWVKEYDTGASMLMCSACEARVIEQAFYNATGTKGRSYCPYCGAKMEAE